LRSITAIKEQKNIKLDVVEELLYLVPPDGWLAFAVTVRRQIKDIPKSSYIAYARQTARRF
jgi:hypothetical protein